MGLSEREGEVKVALVLVVRVVLVRLVIVEVVVVVIVLVSLTCSNESKTSLLTAGEAAAWPVS